MPRESTALPGLGLALDRAVEMPMYQQLYNQLLFGISTGQLQPGMRLPATRTLAAELGVSRNTVLVAYERLLAEGYLDGKVGSGTRVADVHPRPPAAQAPAPDEPSAERRPIRISQAARRMIHASGLLDSAHERLRYPDRPFTLGVPPLDLFPTKAWTKIIAHRSDQLSGASYAHRDPAGYWPLRKEIAGSIGLMRGLRCTADQVIIEPSAQVAVHVAALLLAEPGEEALVENPGFFGMKSAIMAAGVRPCPVDVDGEGMQIKSGAAAHPNARLAAVTPNNQFPLGVRMSNSRRCELVEWARANDSWIIEDDYESEFWTGRPAAPLSQADTGGRVIYAGTFSTVMFPGICLAYLVVSPDLVDVFVAAQRAMVGSLNILTQAALVDFMNTNHFARHIRQMRDVCAERGEVCTQALRARLGNEAWVDSPHSGMHLVLRLPGHVDELRLAQLCRKARLRVYPLSTFYEGEPGGDRGLVLGFGATPPDQILAGVDRLAAAYERLGQESGR